MEIAELLAIIPKLRELGVSSFKKGDIEFTLIPVSTPRAAPQEPKQRDPWGRMFDATSMKPPKR